jgi:IclR family KDG regulon transcriptional repressor
MEKRQENILSSVQNAMRILKSFSLEEPELKVTEIARSLQIGKSAASRLMSTMAAEGFVIKDPKTGRYRLGISALALSGIVTSTLNIYKEAVPILRRLVNEIEETAHLVILEGMDVTYLHIVECKHPLRVFSYVGKKNPIYCTSSGKAILAFQPDEFIDKIINKGLVKYAKNTITDPNKLREELRTIRKRGYAASIDEILEGVSSIGAPIRNHSGKVVAAITIVGPSQRINQSKIEPYSKKAIATAHEISKELGFSL